jgi:hypothetical protein
VFLATLVVAAKYLNDSSPKNKHWAAYAIFFERAELNLMEKQLLYLLDYDLRFDEEEALEMWQPLLASAAVHAIARRAARNQEQAARAAAKRLAIAVPAHDAQLPTPEPSPTGSVSSITSSASSGPPSAPPTQTSFLEVPSGMGVVRARTHSVSTSGNLGMVSSVSLASTVSSAGSLTDDMGTSSSSDDEVRSPADGVTPTRPRSRASFLRMLGSAIARPRSRQSSATTIKACGHSSISPACSTDSITSPLVQPVPRRPTALDSKRFSLYTRANRSTESPLPSPTTAANLLSRFLHGNKDGGKASPFAEVRVVDPDESRYLIGARVRSLPQRAHPLGPRSVISPLRKLRVPSIRFNASANA